MSSWYKNVSPNQPSVVSSRIRLARNIKGLPFPKRMSDIQKREMLDKVKKILDGATLETVGTLKYFDVTDIPEEELFSMVERHIISPDFVKKDGPRALVISEDETLSIMLLEEDHIRIQALLGGLALEKAYEIASSAEDLLAKELTLAFDDQLGFLTECPTNLGTGLRASVMLHLPVLEGSKMVEGLADSVSKIGLTVRGIYGEGSRSKGSLYQLSNQVTLGISEKGAIENLNAITTQIVKREELARNELDRGSIEDNVYRALGTLKYARRISSDEMMNLISRVKLGVTMGILDMIDPALPMTLLIETQPASLQKSAGRMTADDRDICRARIIREQL